MSAKLAYNIAFACVMTVCSYDYVQCIILFILLLYHDAWIICRYMIDIRWLKQWKKYVGYDEWETGMIGEDTANPGPIDNSNLLEGDTVVLTFLVWYLPLSVSVIITVQVTVHYQLTDLQGRHGWAHGHGWACATLPRATTCLVICRDSFFGV